MTPSVATMKEDAPTFIIWANRRLEATWKRSRMTPSRDSMSTAVSLFR